MSNGHSRAAWLTITASVCFSLIIGSWMCAPGVLEPRLQPQGVQSSTPSLPVSIMNDTALATFSPKTGSGTAADPYVIQGLEISANVLRLFYLSDTTMHLTIRNCTFTNLGGGGYGFDIYNVHNLIIEGCTFKNFIRNGLIIMISVSSSTGITIRHNRFQNATGGVSSTIYGIYVENCEDTIVAENTFEDVNGHNVYLINAVQGDSISVLDNTGQDCSGSNFMRCLNIAVDYDTFVIGNSFRNIAGKRTMGVRLFTMFNNSLVQSNSFFGLSGSDQAVGIYVEYAMYARILSNKIENITAPTFCYGIYMQATASHNITFAGNIIASGNTPILLRTGSMVLYATFWHAPTAQYRYLGNYYWNYTGADANGDFIGDTPANCGSGIVDPYPILYGGMDNDGDSLYNAEELETYNTDPNLADTDGDGWNDAYELKVSGTNPLSRDSDGDGKIDSVDATPDYADPASLEGTPDYTNVIYTASGIIGGSLILLGILIVVASRKGMKGQGRTAPDKT
jgi:hypothetical protein